MLKLDEGCDYMATLEMNTKKSHKWLLNVPSIYILCKTLIHSSKTRTMKVKVGHEVNLTQPNQLMYNDGENHYSCYITQYPAFITVISKPNIK